MPDPRCIAEHCEAYPVKNKLCSTHLAASRRGEQIAPKTRGQHDSYGAIHRRLRDERGPARQFACVCCGRGASHWCWDHTDPNKRMSPRGLWCSLDITRYTPMCRKCHAYFDAAHRLRPQPSQGKVRTRTGSRRGYVMS